MIATVTCNATIDKTYFVPGFGSSSIHRLTDLIAVPGGKGVNVARVAQLLGLPVVATGFVAGFNGGFIRHGLDQEGIRHDFVELAGESRLSLNVIDLEAGRQTELLEPGPTVDADDLERLARKVRALAETCRYVVLSGSLPPGCPTDAYARLIAEVQAAGAEAVLDTSGPALAKGLEAGPSLIKPNDEELAKLFGVGTVDEPDILRFVRAAMHESGIRTVIVSLGERGAIAGHNGRLYRVEPPKVSAVNPLGSGDAMVAGCLAGLLRGLEPPDILRLGAACGTANALERQSGFIRLDTVERLFEQVRVAEL